MRYLLSDESRGALEHFAWSNGAVVLDYDGSLAPITEEPAQAHMRPETRRLLDELIQLFPVAVISGRALADVVKMLDGAPVLWVVGNHGAEWSELHADTGKTEQRLRAWRQVLEERLGDIPGVVIEDKRLSLSVHFRRALDWRGAERAVRKVVSQLEGVRVLGGKQVVNLVPQGAPHKGMALERIRMMLGCDLALYVGDDDTDEDVFALQQPDRLLTIRVGASADSRADYFLRQQEEIDELLSILVELRKGGALRPGLYQAVRERG